MEAVEVWACLCGCGACGSTWTAGDDGRAFEGVEFVPDGTWMAYCSKCDWWQGGTREKLAKCSKCGGQIAEWKEQSLPRPKWANHQTSASSDFGELRLRRAQSSRRAVESSSPKSGIPPDSLSQVSVSAFRFILDRSTVPAYPIGDFPKTGVQLALRASTVSGGIPRWTRRFPTLW
jgi:hypothetical protein